MKAVKPANDQDDRDRRKHIRHRKIIASSPPTAVDIHGVRVHFPFRPYDCQKAYMMKVMDALLRSENALLESPTGTGKTLCLLCAALAWQNAQKRQLAQGSQLTQTQTLAGGGSGAKHVPKIIYASRTHSQLSQVVRELRNTRYRPRHAVLGSREQMCVHPQVKKPQYSAYAINQGCDRLCKERLCKYRNKLEGFVAPLNEKGASFGEQPVMDMEDLVAMGKEHKVCPFYYARNQLETAELILVPYNYIFDKELRKTALQNVNWNKAVIILDEAHNLEAFASDSASFELSNADIAQCVREVDYAAQCMEQMSENGDAPLKKKHLVLLKKIFLQLESYVMNLGDRSAYAGEFMMEVFNQGGSINHANHQLFLDKIRLVNELIVDMRGTASTGAPRLEHFAQCLKRVFGYPDVTNCVAKSRNYRVHVSPKPSGTNQDSGRTISYWCFAPSLAMQELADLNLGSIIVTSGTLSPLASYGMELGIRFPHTLENPHIIDDEQIHVRVVGKGVSGKLLTSSYERRKDVEYFIELGNTLVSLARVVPAGMLVFFPSYGVMETCLERWGGPSSNRSRDGGANNFFAARKKQSKSTKFSFPFEVASYFDRNPSPSLWKRLLATKAVVVEPKSTVDLPEAMAEFQKFLSTHKSPGCILMGVCRGKISEGIDFAHEQSRAVVITGLPFPPSFDPKVKMKREYLDTERSRSVESRGKDGGFGSKHSELAPSKLSGHEWYTQQAHRAVNQAIGRVIRNRTDYGAVLLLDSRFDQVQNQQGLSKWLRPHIQPDEGLGNAIKGLVSFYKTAEAKSKAVIEEQSKAVVLEYEDGEEEMSDDVGEVTKITIVSAAGEAKQADDENFVAPNRMIAKIDVEELQKKLPPMASKLDSETTMNEDKRDALFRDKGSFAKDAKRPATKESVPNTAAQFFDKARRMFTPEELSSMKKAVVAMQTHGRNNDIRSYSQSAKEIVELIVQYENVDSITTENHASSLLFLFLKLQSPVHREDIEVLAFKVCFDASAFGQLCQDNLKSGHLGLVRSYMGTLLQDLWCPKSRSEQMTLAEYMPRAENVLQVWKKAPCGLTPAVINAYVKLVPSRFVPTTHSIANEMAATMRMDALRENEKSKYFDAKRDASVLPLQKAKTESSSATAAGTKAKDCSAQEDVLQSNSNVLKRKLETPSASTTNPYVKKKHGDAPTQSKAASKALPKTNRSLSSLIKKVESEPFVKRSSSEIVSSINSNAPANICCPICTKRLEQPFIAECGHMACLPCWQSWFKRSQSCPTCRSPTSTSAISRAVFQRHDGGSQGRPKAPTLSQLCDPQVNVDQDESEDELEFCS